MGMRWFNVSLAILITAIALAPAGASAQKGRSARRLAQLEARVAALEAILQYVRVESEPINGLVGPHWIVEGANLHVRSGSGSTHGPCPDDPGCAQGRGLGNLLVGYNEAIPSGARLRTGMHNLVVGPEHSYLSRGGLVAGSHNSVWGQGASVTGGVENRASGDNASICGGERNIATGTSSTVGGGLDNWARGDSSSVGGGGFNVASGVSSSVSGGGGNVASGESSSVTGGFENEASGPRSSVSGGAGRTAPTDDDWAAGSLLEPN
jgi:hypothetical protein